MKITRILGLLLFVSFVCGTIFTLSSFKTKSKNAEEAAVVAAVEDYVEGLYQVKPERIERSVHPDLKKRGYWYSSKEEKYSGMLDMTFEQLKTLAGKWNKDGKNANADSPKKIEVFDVLDKTAVAKLTAEWGIDYFQLAKIDDKWMIVNVLWQSHPQDM